MNWKEVLDDIEWTAKSGIANALAKIHPDWSIEKIASETETLYERMNARVIGPALSKYKKEMRKIEQ